MKSKLSIYLFFLTITLWDCSYHSQTNLSVYRAFASSLNNSNFFITSQNLILFKLMEKKASDPTTAFKTSIWQPKALLIKKLTSEMTNYVDTLKFKLKQSAGLSIKNNAEFFKEDDLIAVSTLFIKGDNGEMLKKRLMNYEADVLAVDPNIRATFIYTINTTIRLTDPSENQKSFSETFFNNIPTVGAIAVLCKFENNVKTLENQLINYCYNQIPSSEIFAL